MNHEPLRQCLHREIRALKRELDAYPDDASLWAQPPGVTNSGGSLMLHLAGNIQHYFGKCLGGTSYVRNRDAEFSRRNVPRAELTSELDAAAVALDAGFDALTDRVLAAEFPEKVGGFTLNTATFITHLVAHFGYHLGQIDYHRRLVTGDGTSVGPIPVKELAQA